jgi:cytosine/adenosine deaminase-related metal-dependent hydrolase
LGGKLFYGGWLIRDWSQAEPLEAGALYEEAGRIVAVGGYQELRYRYPEAPAVGNPDLIVAPGFVNAHSHGRGLTTYQMGQPDEPLEVRIVEMMSRPEWTGQEDAACVMPGRDPYWDTLYSCAKQLASGITTTLHIDQYMFGSAEAYERHARRVCDAYRDSGIRCAFALGIRDQSTFAFADEEAVLDTLDPEERATPDLRTMTFMPFDAFASLLDALSGDYPGINFQMGPWNPAFCSEKLMGEIAEASRREGRRVHTHLMETHYQAALARKRYGKSCAAYLDEIGMLSPRFSGAHCVWFDATDIGLMQSAGGQVVHNPASNLRLQSGLAPLADMLAAGIPVGIGIDSLGMNDDEDLFQDMRLAQMMQSRPGIDETLLPAATLLSMATRNGAQITGFDGAGTLGEGSLADVIMLSMSEIEGVPTGRPLVEMVLRRAKPAHVKNVVVGGRVLIEDGRWKDGDPAALLRELGEKRGAPAAEPPEIARRLKARMRDYLRGEPPARRH